MRRFIIIAIIISFSGVGLHAQKPASNKKDCACGFQSILQGGFLEGASGPSWNAQTINGMYYQGWFAGIGVGLDYYMMRTVPAFLALRKDLFHKRATPFLYADGGIHFDWLKSEEKPGWGSSEYYRRLYYDIGAGYKFGVGKNDAFVLSAGYSLKTLSERRSNALLCIMQNCNTITEYYKFNFTRLTFKVGWQFR